MMKKLFTLNIAIEILGGLILFCYPQILTYTKNTSIDTIYIAMLVGIQAIFIGALLLIINNFIDGQQMMKIGYALFFYNIATGLFCLYIFNKNISQTLLPTATHMLLSLAWISVIVFKNRIDK